MLSHHDFSSPCETAPAFRGQSCAGRTLQPFFGVVGTFVSSLCAASLLRALLAATARRLCAAMGVGGGGGGGAGAPGLELGAYELHVVKTSHLGLCQASLPVHRATHPFVCLYLRPSIHASGAQLPFTLRRPHLGL